MDEMIESVYCPAVSAEIDIGLCEDIQMVADNCIHE